MKKIAVIIPNGFEETEAITTIDILRRAMEFSNGKIAAVDTFTLSAKDLQVCGAHNLVIKADMLVSQLQVADYSAIVFPGGPGHINYFEDNELAKITLAMAKDKKIIAAICAAPQYLGLLGLVDGKEIVHFPTTTKYLEKAILNDKKAVMQTENIITGTSIAAALDFGILIAKNFLEKNQHDDLVKSLVIR